LLSNLWSQDEKLPKDNRQLFVFLINPDRQESDMSNRIVPFFAFALLFSLLIAAGCGQPKISGKVVFSDDQSPVTKGVVMFHGDHGVARGDIQPDGSFVVSSLKQNDGLPPGKYSISIKETQINLTPRGQGLPNYKNVIDKKYANQNTSGLILNVTKSQSFDIQVDRFVENR
jgi:hypothetical protein